MKQIRVLIAGAAGASLGTEVVKSLSLANTLNKSHQYQFYICDISPLAYGLHLENIEKTFVPSIDNYTKDIFEFCMNENIKYILPGGEAPMMLLNKVKSDFQSQGVYVLGNSQEVIDVCNNKAASFERLKDLGFNIPESFTVKSVKDLDAFDVPFPCVIKPSTGTGGSHFVFLADNKADLVLYSKFLFDNKKDVLIQAYVPLDEGEFTIGVLSSPDKMLVGSIALQRSFHSKLSYSFKGEIGLISSGYSQGIIDDYAVLRKQAEKIAYSLESTGPLNIQARVIKGNLIPFEINPRFSASTYLRSLAGFNEIDFYIRHFEMGERNIKFNITNGYYLRSLTEKFVPFE